MNKPVKPNITIPASFADNGVKAPFDNEHMLNGFPAVAPDVLAGDNLNEFIDNTYKGLNYSMAASDALNLLEDGHTLIYKDGKLQSSLVDGLKGKITNCITEIPQRIKVELNDGILTLKAGSEVIYPNGFEDDGVTLKFNYVTIANDKYCGGTTTEGTGKLTICCDSDGGLIERFGHASGSTPSGDEIFYYDTTNNIVTDRLSSREVSFPICSVTVTTVDAGNVITSIDEVLNGFGYIGQCTFVDKGVKALLPNGRNEDGTLKNIETVTTAITVTDLTNQTSILSFFDGTTLYGYGVDNYIVSDNKPTITTTHAMWYCPRENFVYSTSDGGATWLVTEKIYAGLLTKTEATGSITFMTPKNTFKAVDYNELEEVELIPTGYDTPVSVTNGWVATENGQLYVYGYSDSESHYLEVYIDGNIVYLNRQSGSNANNHRIGSTTQIFKGQTITVYNSGAYTLTFYPYKY